MRISFNFFLVFASVDGVVIGFFRGFLWGDVEVGIYLFVCFILHDIHCRERSSFIYIYSSLFPP